MHARSPSIAIMALVLACNPARDSRRTSVGAPTPSVTVTATDYALQAPDSIRAGFTTFHLENHGDQMHMAQLVKIEDGRTFQDFLPAYEQAFRAVGRRPDWAPRRGGPGVADPHGESNSTQYLEPGSYAWICIMNVPDGIPHIVKHKMGKPFVVVPGPDSASQEMPTASVVARLVDYGFELSAPPTAGRTTIRVENAGNEPHEFGLLKLAPGKTIEDLRKWIQRPDGPPPMTAIAGGVASLAPKMVAFFDVNLTPGDYALICVVTAPDGKSHIEHGMIKQIRIA